MDFVNKFITDFIRLPETFNELAEQQRSFSYYKAFYYAAVRAPYGENYLCHSPVKGFHFRIDINLEPISEDAEIVNNHAAFSIDDSFIKEIKFVENGKEETQQERKLTEDNCSIFIAELERFCQKSLSR